jgi:dimethylargininase
LFRRRKVRVFDFNRAIVRRPAKSVIRGERAAPDGADPSFDGVVAEHVAYIRALEAAGLKVETLPPLEAFPDSIFVEDPALVFPEAAILLRPGAASREDEPASLEPTLRNAFDNVLSIEEGAADGGDVLVTPAGVYIGMSGRTDRRGAEALATILQRLGRTAIVVDTPKGTLHLKTACSLVDEETVLVTPALAESGLFDGFRKLVVHVDELGAANIVRLNDTVLVGAHYPRTIDQLVGHGLDVKPLPVTEIGKIDAGLSCMSLRWQAPLNATRDGDPVSPPIRPAARPAP